MSLEKTGNVCLTCRFFEDHKSTCQRYPPSVQITTTDDLGQEDVYWVQPTIDLEWSTTCGEWAADNPEETPYQRVTRIGQRINERGVLKGEWKPIDGDKEA